MTTIGDTDNFPAFYSRETSLFNPVKSPSRVSNAQEAASLLRIQQRLALERGILFAVPIPEAHALDSTEVETLIQEALEIAEKRGIQGKYVTPFLLEQLNQLTSGGFLKASKYRQLPIAHKQPSRGFAIYSVPDLIITTIFIL